MWEFVVRQAVAIKKCDDRLEREKKGVKTDKESWYKETVREGDVFGGGKKKQIHI